MKYYKILLNNSVRAYLMLVVLGIANSLWATFLLILLNGIADPSMPLSVDHPIPVYFVLIVVSYVTSRYFQTLLTEITSQSSYDFQQVIFKNLRSASLEDFETIDHANIYTALGDALTISEFPRFFVEAFNALTYIVCGLAFLFYISPITATFIIVIIVALAYRYVKRNKKIEAQGRLLRDQEDSYYRTIDDFIRGFRQLKMNSRRSNNIFFNFLDKNRRFAKAINTRVALANLNNDLLGYYSWYLVLGMVVFLGPKFFALTNSQLTSFIVSILFLINPLISMVSLIPIFTRIKVALDRLEAFLDLIRSPDQPNPVMMETKMRSFQKLKLVKASFSYGDSVRNFQLGPIDFELEKGTIVFVTGGNGSGKSTFINVLNGLYKPSSGKIIFNDLEIDEVNASFYRDHLSCVFADHHLFSENYDGYDLAAISTELQSHIDKFKLTNVIELHGDTIGTKLSKGQQKRVALIYALLEDKDLIVLDEWAAEQDPDFRDYFYQVLLPDLKACGKTIVAVTHDNNYYQFADRIVEFEYGQIKK